MKVKDAKATCGPMGNVKHMGHFVKAEHLNRGHNTDIRNFLGMGPKKSLFEQEMEKAKAREAAPAPVAPAAPAPAAPVDASKRRQQIDEELRKAGG